MNPVIAAADYHVLKTAILKLPNEMKTKEIGQLIEEFENGNIHIVSDDKITPDVIRLNSYFETEEEKTKRVLKFTLTLPHHANLAQKKISVLSPLAIALIGFKEGMTVDCALPVGTKKMKITKVVNP